MTSAFALVLFLVFAPLVLGQIPPAPPPSDSAGQDRIVLQDPGISMGKPTFLIPPRFMNDLNFSAPSNVDDGGPLVGAPRFLLAPDVKLDLISPLRLQWKRDAELKTLKTILGSVSFGGAAYLAIRSLQKSNSKPPLPRQIKAARP